MKKQICFVTSLFYNDNNIIDVPYIFEKNINYDYILFTNRDPIEFNTSWTIIQVNPSNKNHIINSRYYKFLGWKYFKENNIDYDYIFYCDAILVPKININWEYLCNLLDLNKFKFIQGRHRYASSIIYEFDNIYSHRKDTKENLLNSLKFLNSINLNGKVNLNKSIFYENFAFGYNLKDIYTLNFLEKFWDLYTDTKYVTYRDQPLWTFFILQNDINPVLYPYNNNIMMEAFIVSKSDTHTIETYLKNIN